MRAVDSSVPADWCSARSADEPLPGTAAHVRTWVLLEVPSGWGRDVYAGEVLGGGLAPRLEKHLAACGSRLLFIRRPGREGQRVDRPALYVCDTRPGGVVRAGTVDGPADLLDLDLSADGRLPDSRRVAAPLALVCTHGRRDRCCAVRGRPVAAELERRLGERLAAADPDAGVWECSHTGGHRFAPTGLLLPHARMLARLTPKDPAALLSAAGAGQLPEHLLGAVHDRGSTALPPSAQAAEAYLRHLLAETDLSALRAEVVAGEDEAWVVRVVHTDGRAWTLSVTRVPLPQPRPVSCGKEPTAAHHWQVELDSGPVR